jgi:hypothetical protein
MIEHDSTADVRDHRGVPTLFVNGQPRSGASYMSYVPQERYYRDSAEQGISLFTFSATSDYSYYQLAANCWLGLDQYDYTQLDERVAMILQACPQAEIIPLVYVSAPPWWCDAHPDELCVTADGQFVNDTGNNPPDQRVASLGSEPWRRDTSENLRRFIAHIQNSSYAQHIIGYELSCGITEEWMYWGFQARALCDYSPANLAAWRRWLLVQYGDDTTLQRAWQQPSATCGTAAIPDAQARLASTHGGFLDPLTQQATIDYNRYLSWVTVDTIKALGAVVKDATERRKLYGVYYGYLLEISWSHFSMPSGGHLALGDLLACPDVDFLSSPTSYTARQLGTGYSSFMSLTESIHLHGKVWYDQNDIRTALVDVPTGTYGRAATLGESIEQQWREAGNVLAHGTPMWWFDMGGGWYDHPDLLAVMRSIGGLLEASLTHDCSSAAEIALVVDEVSPCYWQFDDLYHHHALSEQRLQLGRIGAPVDYILLSDIGNAQLKDYKLYLFANAFVLDSRQRAVIRARLARNHATAIWVYAPGVVDGTFDPLNSQRLTGIALAMAANGSSQPSQVVFAPWLAEAVGMPSYGPPEGFSPRFHVSQPDVSVLGSDSTNGLITLAAREVDGFHSIYAAAPCLPAVLVRYLADEAGVHIYTRGDDAFYANRSYLCLNANGAGTRELILPRICKVVDLRSGAVLAEHSDRVAVELEDKQTLLLGLE